MFCAVVIIELPDNSTGDQVMMAIEPSPSATQPPEDDKMEDTNDMMV